MMISFIRKIFCSPVAEASAAEKEYAPLREKLTLAGLSEEQLRRMEPDDRVAALEKARLDPYDYIFLAC